MLCFKRFSYLFAFVFSVFLCTLLSTIITSGDVFATSIQCQDFSNSLNQYDFTSSHLLFYDFSGSCDTSSLDSSKQWFYTIDFSFNNNSNRSVYILLAYDSTIGLSSYEITLGNMRAFTSNSFSFLAVDSYNSAFSYRRYSRFVLNTGSNFLSGSTLTFSDFSMLISDEYPYSDCPESPIGTLNISENGTYDVTSYASAVVDVPPIMGDYHDDLVNIKKAIYTGCAVLLVLYFFYCIYRMIIKGVKK